MSLLLLPGCAPDAPCPVCAAHTLACRCPRPAFVPEPGQEVLASFAAPRRLDTRGSWGGGVTWRARVVRVENRPDGVWVTVEARGVRRRVKVEALRPVEVPA